MTTPLSPLVDRVFDGTIGVLVFLLFWLLWLVACWRDGAYVRTVSDSSTPI